MLFIPTLPEKVEFTAMLRMLSNAKNVKWWLGWLGKMAGKRKFLPKQVPRAAAAYGWQLKIFVLEVSHFKTKSVLMDSSMMTSKSFWH